MKYAYLLHGTGGSDKDYYWYGDTKKYIESKGYKVWWPLLPHTEKPTLEETLDYVLDHWPPDINEQTIIVAHSSACPLTLSLLEGSKVTIKQAILVAGFYQSLDDEGYSELMLQKQYDWNSIKKACSEFVLINSDNDPWGCNDTQARPVAEKLNANLVVAFGQGHMGSQHFKQPYKEFPLVKRLLAV